MRGNVRDTRPHVALAWLGLGATVVGVAFALRPHQQASRPVFWSVLIVGLAAICVGAVTVLTGRMRSASKHRHDKRKRLLAASACERYADALSVFIATSWGSKPRPLPFGNGASRLQRWQEAVEASFRKNFRTWGLETFDEAARCGAVAASLRSSVEAPSIEQLQQLPDLFRDAARSLERG